MKHNQRQFNPATRGYHSVYHAGEVNHCPGCGRTHWLIGRLSAECAFCSTALPFTVEGGSIGMARPVFHNRHTEQAARGRFTINGRA